MQLSDLFLRLGLDNFQQMVRSISLGRLRTYEMFDRAKVRLHVTKLNSEVLRKIGPRLWIRIEEGDQELATDLSQMILVSHMDMIQAVLDHLGVPHEGGFFAKDADVANYLKDGWQKDVMEHFRGKFPEGVLLFYVNHLAVEMAKAEEVFLA